MVPPASSAAAGALRAYKTGARAPSRFSQLALVKRGAGGEGASILHTLITSFIILHHPFAINLDFTAC